MKLIVFFVVALVLPPAIILSRNGDVFGMTPMLLSTAGFALLLYAVTHIFKRISPRLAIVTGIVVLLALLTIRYLLGFLYDFSGRGFTSEVFAHINATAFGVAMEEYDHEAWAALIIFSILAYFTARLINRQNTIPLARSFSALLISLPLIYFGASASPELQLAQAYERYSQPELLYDHASNKEIRDQSADTLNMLRPGERLPVEISDLEASAPDKPLNLVLVYLESFNESLVNHSHYPGLTPRIDELKQRLHSFDLIHSSGYVTIEGIANSHCGTLMNMEYANSSLINRRGRLPNLPCLGDILKAAGYHQTYLGGAELNFAGKGAFFREHGYDKVLGWEHWDDQDYERFNNWGLSDTTLFNEAYNTIQTYRKQGRPYNVTMLTLGMHVPGFVYDECPVYAREGDKPFVNAIHCADYLLGEFVDRLEQNGVLKDTVLYIQADHGSFLTPEVIRQVGNKVFDTRLLTLLSLPDSLKLTPEQLRLHAEGSNLNMVATLMDLLQIKHNSGYLLAKSHLDGSKAQPYYPTRRQDYAQNRRFENDRYGCTEPARNRPVQLPLDDCDKNRVMQAVSALNLSYSIANRVDNQICELAANISLAPDTDKVEVKWGNQNLSDQFYRRGTKRNKHQTKGIYAVVMDEDNRVAQTLFYEPFREEDMRDIAELFKSSESGQHLLLVRNADMTEQEPNIQKMWPALLRDQSIVYGVFKEQGFEPEFVSSEKNPQGQFTPASCQSQ